MAPSISRSVLAALAVVQVLPVAILGGAPRRLPVPHYRHKVALVLPQQRAPQAARLALVAPAQRVAQAVLAVPRPVPAVAQAVPLVPAVMVVKVVPAITRQPVRISVAVVALVLAPRPLAALAALARHRQVRAAPMPMVAVPVVPVAPVLASHL